MRAFPSDHHCADFLAKHVSIFPTPPSDSFPPAPQRRVWLSWDAARIHWAEPDAPATKDTTIRVEDILRVDAGAASKVFGGSLAAAERASTAVQNACFTIVSAQRTLDLQVSQTLSRRCWFYVDHFRVHCMRVI